MGEDGKEVRKDRNEEQLLSTFTFTVVTGPARLHDIYYRSHLYNICFEGTCMDLMYIHVHFIQLNS